MARSGLKYMLVLIKGLASFIIFFVSSQIFTLLIPIPFIDQKNSARNIYTRLLTFYARLVLKTHFNIHIKYINREKNTFDKPAMIVCNHQSMIDVPISLAFTSKMRVLNNNWHDNAWARFFITKYIGFFSIFENKDKLVRELKKPVEMGCPLLVFPEGKLSHGQKIIRLHKGGFYIAEKLNIDILPVVIYYSEDVLKKRWFYLKNGDVIVKFLDRVEYGSKNYGATYQELTDNVMEKMRSEFANIHRLYQQGGF